MRKRTMKTIIAVAAALFMWAGMAPAMAAPVRAAAPGGVPSVGPAPTSGATASTSVAVAPAPAAPARPVVYDCDGWRHGQAKVRRIYLTCDTSVIVTVAGWKYWTAISARSRGGKLLVDTCQPDCAAGHYRKYASTLIFYRARSRHGVRYFTRMRLRYWHGRFRSYVYRWERYPGGIRPVWVGGP
jgi:hypothetical protein